MKGLPEDQHWFTISEVATEFHVSAMTVYRLVHSGRLKAKRIGRSFRISRNELADFLRMADASDGNDSGLWQAGTSGEQEAHGSPEDRDDNS